MSFQHVLMIIWARKWIVAAIFLATVLTAAAVSLLMPKEYTASATVVLDVQTPDRLVGMVLPGMTSPAYMATQMDIISSDRVARSVVRQLKLDQNPTVRNDWREETGGSGTIAEWLAPLLKKKLDVIPSRESNVIQIEFSAGDPAFAAMVANGFAQAYIETTIELRAEPARKYAAWFEKQFKSQRERLREAQQSLSDFQQNSGIVVTDERLDFENQRLGELTAQLTLAQAEGTDSISKKNVTQVNDTLPEVMRNPLVLQLKGEIARLESRMKEISVNFGENHPEYLNTQAELSEMKARLNQEITKIAESISTVGRVSEAKVTELKQAITDQKTRMLELRDQRDQITILQQEVDAAQRDFDSIRQRLTQSQLEAQTVQTNVSILTPPAIPLEPSKPMVFLNIIVAVFLGALLAMGTALLLELGRSRVRSKESLETLLGVPVLAQVNSVSLSKRTARKKVPTKNDKIDEPLPELNEHASTARGA